MKRILLAAILVLAPSLASAVSLTIDDLTNGVGNDVIVAAGPGNNAFYLGSAGSFNVDIASGVISTIPQGYQLNGTSIETSGIGSLKITVQEGGLSFSALELLTATGTGSVSQVGVSVTISHYIDLGAGFQLLDGSSLNFGSTGSGTIGPVDLGSGASSIKLRTVYDITTSAGNEISNVNSTLTVTGATPDTVVPLPAAAWLFGSALLGLVTVARRKAVV